jgi:hypothetical protein
MSVNTSSFGNWSLELDWDLGAWSLGFWPSLLLGHWDFHATLPS